MPWKIEQWLMNRTKRYLVFIHYGPKQYWDSKEREWKWSKVRSRFDTTTMELKEWDVNHNYLNSYAKNIWMHMEEGDRPKYHVSITGITKI